MTGRPRRTRVWPRGFGRLGGTARPGGAGRTGLRGSGLTGRPRGVGRTGWGRAAGRAGWGRRARLPAWGGFGACALLVALALGGAVVTSPGATTGPPGRTADYAVVVGAAGLRWDDVSPTGTPALWAMAQRGALGVMSVRSARKVTCASDGWLSLGAGNFAEWPASASRQVVTDATPTGCPPITVDIRVQPGGGAQLPEHQAAATYNAGLTWGAHLGALAGSVRCSVAVGPGAAIAAAVAIPDPSPRQAGSPDRVGRVDRYVAALPDDAEAARQLLASCVLSFVDLGTVAGEGTDRTEAVHRFDTELAKVLAARPERSVVLVGGVADTGETSRLHVAVADGPAYTGGLLTSGSTGRPGYTQLVDVAPTVLASLGKARPAKVFAGQPAFSTGPRPGDLAAAVGRLADTDREAAAHRRVAGVFLLALAIAQTLLFILLIPVLRRLRSTDREPRESARVPARVLSIAQVALVAMALTVPAALVADAVPWWRAGAPGAAFVMTTLGLVAAYTAAVRFGPWWRRPLGPLAAVSGLSALIVIVDLMSGSRLQLNGVAGYSTADGVRYTGLGPIGFGVLAVGVLLASGCLAQAAGRRARPYVVAVVGALGVVLVGSPYLGADAGGAIALTAGACVAAAVATGGWMTFPRVAWAVLAGVVVTAGFAMLDLRRPEEQRGMLGRFLTHLNDGTAGLTVKRVAEANLLSFLSGPLTLLVIVSLAYAWAVLFRPWGGLRRTFGLYPAVHATMVGASVAAALGGLFDGSSVDVAGAIAATAVPLATLAGLRALTRAETRRSTAEPLVSAKP